MSEFGGFWKREKTQHALVGLGSAALAADCNHTQVRRPEFSDKVCKKHHNEAKTKNPNTHTQMKTKIEEKRKTSK